MGIEENVLCAEKLGRIGAEIDMRPVAGSISTFVPESHIALHVDEFLGLVVFEMLCRQLLGSPLQFHVTAQLGDASVLGVGNVAGGIDGFRVGGGGREYRSRRKLQDVTALRPRLFGSARLVLPESGDQGADSDCQAK